MVDTILEILGVLFMLGIFGYWLVAEVIWQREQARAAEIRAYKRRLDDIYAEGRQRLDRLTERSRW